LDKNAALVISAIDPLNGAGFTLDITLLEIMGIKAMGIPTALLPQDTSGVRELTLLEPAPLLKSFNLLMSVIKLHGLKVSIMGKLIEYIPEIIRRIKGPKVFDPIIEPGGFRIYENADNLMEIIPLFDIITPNIPEAREILSDDISSPEELCKKMANVFGIPVYLKGGHSDAKIDYFCNTENELVKFLPERIFKYEVHGTGCFFSTALLGYLLKGFKMEEALLKARQLLSLAYEKALDTGKGKRLIAIREISENI